MTSPHAPLTHRQRLVGLGFAVALVASFAAVVVAGGHGVAPVGLILLARPADPFSALGWGAVALLAASPFVGSWRTHATLGVVAAGVLVALWLGLVSRVAEASFTLMTSVPFGVVLVLHGLRLVRGSARRRGRVP